MKPSDPERATVPSPVESYVVEDIFTAALCVTDSREAADRVVEYLRRFHTPVMGDVWMRFHAPTAHEEAT